MLIFPCKQTTFFDVDDTLVMWNATQQELDARGVWFECPPSTWTVDPTDPHSVPAPVPAWQERLLPHRYHIEQLKKHKIRGHTIVVWSAGGYDWAAAVVKALKLEEYVDLVISKPIWAYDDLQPNEFIPKVSWKKDEV